MIKLYTIKKLSVEKIAQSLNKKSDYQIKISIKRVRKWLKEYNIPRRDPTTSLIGKHSHKYNKITDTYNIWHEWEK